METAVRLKAVIWVQAHLRRCNGAGLFAALVRRGDETAGSVLIKLNDLAGGFQVLSPARRGDGTRIWLRATGAEPVDEAQADGYIERQLKFDPDIWVIEIEDRAGRHLLNEPVE